MTSERAAVGSLGRDRAFPIILTAAYAVAVGQGLVLPFLPDLLARVEPAGAAAHGREVGLVMAVYFAGGLATASYWGRLSDRFGRRQVMLIGMTGFAVTLALTTTATSLAGLYLLRALNGAFGVAVIPVGLAAVADRFPDGPDRGRRFAWINAAVVIGFLSGPALGELAAAGGWRWPFYASALFAASAALPLLGMPATARTPMARPASGQPGRRSGLALTLAVSALAAGGLAAMEVVVAMAPEARGLTRQSVSFLFSLCALLMLAAQLLQFRGQDAAWRATRRLRTMLALETIALGGVALAGGIWGLAISISILAWSTATLMLLTSYLASRQSPAAQGWGLGLQSAAATAGQLAGSSLVSWLDPTRGVGALWLFALATGLLCLGGFPLRARR